MAKPTMKKLIKAAPSPEAPASVPMEGGEKKRFFVIGFLTLVVLAGCANIGFEKHQLFSTRVALSSWNEINISASKTSRRSEESPVKAHEKEVQHDQKADTNNNHTTKSNPFLKNWLRKDKKQQSNDNVVKYDAQFKWNQMHPNTSLINDKTLKWDPEVERYWLDPELANPMEVPPEKKPPAQILLTTLGWNQPNQTLGMKFMRSARETWLFEGVINHPYFHPTGWDDIESGKVEIQPDIQYYVFLDKFQCYDHHYPTYGAPGMDNLDLSFGRADKGDAECWNLYGCGAIRNLIQTARLFREAPSNNTRFVYIDCIAWAHEPLHTEETLTWPVSMAVMETTLKRINPEKDMGLPPPAIKPVTLTDEQVADIETCEAETKRKLYMLYRGNVRSGPDGNFHARGKLIPFHNESAGRLVLMPGIHDQTEDAIMNQISYGDQMSDTIFTAAPRGDCKYSYRFAEVLSAGGILVYLGDNYVWPFRPELVKWEECAVILPERDVTQTLSRLREISIEERCERRKKCYSIWKNYMETGVGTITGIVDSLLRAAELDAKGLPHPKFSGYHCKADPENPTYCNIN